MCKSYIKTQVNLKNPLKINAHRQNYSAFELPLVICFCLTPAGVICLQRNPPKLQKRCSFIRSFANKKD